MEIRKISINDTDDLIKQFLPSDYSEVYECIFESDKSVNPDDLMIDFWMESPKWITFLFKLRNILVRPFGIKEDNYGQDRRKILEDTVKNRVAHSIMSIPAKNKTETVMLLKDKHLDAYISVYYMKENEQKQKIRINTLVNFNNLLGKVYFGLIFYFHHLIVKSKLRQMVKILN